jgi:hypothetical protein
MINQHDIEAFAEMSIAELLNQITVLHTEINYAKDQLQPHRSYPYSNKLDE